jgi:hypothetical protein
MTTFACGVLQVGEKWCLIRAAKGEPDNWEAVNGTFTDEARAQAAADHENRRMGIPAAQAAEIIAGIHKAGG